MVQPLKCVLYHQCPSCNFLSMYAPIKLVQGYFIAKSRDDFRAISSISGRLCTRLCTDCCVLIAVYRFDLYTHTKHTKNRRKPQKRSTQHPLCTVWKSVHSSAARQSRPSTRFIGSYWSFLRLNRHTRNVCKGFESCTTIFENAIFGWSIFRTSQLRCCF